jgi:hypothetical protein
MASLSRQSGSVELMAKGDGWQIYNALSEWTQLLLPRWRSASARLPQLPVRPIATADGDPV